MGGRVSDYLSGLLTPLNCFDVAKEARSEELAPLSLEKLSTELNSWSQCQCLLAENRCLVVAKIEDAFLQQLTHLELNGINSLPQVLSRLPDLQELVLDKAPGYFRPDSLKHLSVRLQTGGHWPTLAETVNAANDRQVLLDTPEKITDLLKYADKNIMQDARWGLENSSLINQLLIRDRDPGNDEITTLTNKLARRYSELKEVKALLNAAQVAKKNRQDYMLNNPVLLSADGSEGIILAPGQSDNRYSIEKSQSGSRFRDFFRNLLNMLLFRRNASRQFIGKAITEADKQAIYQSFPLLKALNEAPLAAEAETAAMLTSGPANYPAAVMDSTDIPHVAPQSNQAQLPHRERARVTRKINHDRTMRVDNILTNSTIHDRPNLAAVKQELALWVKKQGRNRHNARIAESKILEAFEKNLTSLDLSGLEMTSIPSVITEKLLNLTHLNLSGNQLRELPDSIANLSNMIELNVSYNRLTCLPADIGKLKSLTMLNLQNNNLKVLPDNIIALKKLTKLNVDNNRLT